jgi:hypothetical protein
MHGVSVDEERIQRWLDWLRDGSEADKIAARRGLAGVFEQRGMLDEAIELLETNVRAGVRGADTLRRLSLLYQAQENEISSFATAVTVPHTGEAVGVLSPSTSDLAAPPTGGAAVRSLMPVLVMMVGLGILLGGALWMLSPL